MKWEIRLHGRGGQGVVTASRILAQAAYISGFEAQAIPFFGAERRGSPVVAFTRISDSPIRERSMIYSPDYVIVFDSVVASSAFRGLKSGGGVTINATELHFRFEQSLLKFAIVDAANIAAKFKTFVNTPMLGAFLRIFPQIDLKSLEDAVVEELGNEANVFAVREAYRAAKVKVVKGGYRCKEEEERFVSVTLPVSTPSAGVAGKTGLWRDVRPVIDYDACNRCMSCWIHCPEAAIKKELAIDYEFCKGCMICAAVCKANAIKAEREVWL